MAATNTFEIDILAKMEQAISALDKLQSKLGETGGKGSTSFTELNQAMELMQKTLGAITSTFGEFTDLAATQQLAEMKLANSMKNMGDATGEGTKMLMEQASALQEVSGYGDEATISAQAMLGTFALNADQIAVLTPRLQDMAAALQQTTGQAPDLQQLAVQLGKATTGSASSLKRYGVTLTDAQAAQLDAAEGMDKITKLAEILDQNFKGMSETLGDSAAGEMRKMDAAVGDLKENIGFLIIEFAKPFRDALYSAVNLFKQFSDRSSTASKVMRTLMEVGRPLAVAIGILVTAYTAYTIATNAAAIATGIMQNAWVKAALAFAASPFGAAVLIVTAAGTAFYTLATASDEAIDSIREWSPLLAEIIDKFQEGIAVIREWAGEADAVSERHNRKITADLKKQDDAVIQSAKNWIDEEKKKNTKLSLLDVQRYLSNVKASGAAWKATEEYYQKIYNAAKKTGEATDSKAGKNAYDKLVAQYAREQALVLAQQELNGATEQEKFDTKLMYMILTIDAAKKYGQETVDLENQMAIAKLQNEKRVNEELKKENEKRLKARKSFDEMLQKFQIERSSELDKELLESEFRLESELATFTEWLNNKEVTEEEYEALREQARSAHLDRMADIEADHRDAKEKEEKESKKNALDEERAKNEAIISGTQSMFGDLAAASYQNFELQKGFKTAEALIATYSSAAKAYEALSFFPPLAAIAAAAATAAGLANVAAIQAQKPSFATGGYTGDMPEDMPAGVVHGREYVSDARTTSKYRRQLDALNRGATPEQAFGMNGADYIGGAQSRGRSRVGIDVSGQFVIDGQDLKIAIARAIQTDMAGTF